jgi:Fe-S oxidoreductase
MSKSTRGPIPPGLTYIADNINSGENILGLPRSAKSKWAHGIEFSKGASTVFFAGCGYQYSPMLEPLSALVKKIDNMSINPDLPVILAGVPRKLGVDVAGIYAKLAPKNGNDDVNVLRDAVRVLKALGVEPGYLGAEEPCCGAPLYHMGLRREFTANSQKAFEKLKLLGVKELISIVPSCTHALRNLFPKTVPGFDINVRHFIEVAAARVGHVKLKYPEKVKVVFHDPCQLGRYLGLFEQPRQVLRAIQNVELVEPAWTSGEWSTCCGGGGGFEAVFPDMSQTLASGRVRELAATGADIIATHCPGCLMQLKSGLKPLKDKKIEIIDLASLIAKSLPE